jgi:hypothetical protein
MAKIDLKHRFRVAAKMAKAERAAKVLSAFLTLNQTSDSVNKNLQEVHTKKRIPASERPLPFIDIYQQYQPPKIKKNKIKQNL